MNRFFTILVIVIGGCSFIIATKFMSQVSEHNLPHGTVLALYTSGESSGVALTDGHQSLNLDSNGILLKLISQESFQGYLRPPFMRDECYTARNNVKLVCIWADIDIANYEEALQWTHYLFQTGFSILAGLGGGRIMDQMMRRKSTDAKII